MGAMTLDLAGWRKDSASGRPTPVEKIHIHVTEACHLCLEQAEMELQRTHQPEKFIDIDPVELEVAVSSDCGPLADCQLRVYQKPGDEHCHFHLVGHRRGDNSLVYSNSVLVDALV